MLKIYKQIVSLGLIIMMTVHVSGQSTNSPFSMYGIGNLGDARFGRSTAMGGIVAPLYSSFHLNPENPASYTALGMNSFIFEIGATSEYLQLNAPDATYDNFNGNFSYLAIGFPITKWLKSGIGIVPLTSIGYDIEQVVDVGNDGDQVVTSYRGEGGITNFYFDNSIKVINSLSLGFKFSYMFGPLIYNEKSVSFNDNSTSSINRQDKANISAFTYKAGMHFHKQINEKFFLNVGATYGLESDLEAEDHLFITNAVSRTNGLFVDTIVDATVNVGVLQIPQSYSLGASVIFDKKIELGADYSKSMWSSAKYFDQDQNFADAEKFAFGAEYTPDYSGVSYAKTIRYRLGSNFSKSYLMYEGEQLQSYSFTFGIGLPVKKTASVLNFAFSYKKRYIPSIDVLSENYYAFQFNMSLHAIWFKKRVWE